MKNSPIKVYDARWEIGDYSDIEIKRLFLSSCIYADKLNIDTVVISRDARLGCPGVVKIATETALNAGFTVYLCQDPVSTPQSYYNALRITEKIPGTMGWTITASHNPAAYIGVKFVVSPVRAIGMESGPRGGLTKIQEIYNKGNMDYYLKGKKTGYLSLINFSDDYIKDSMSWAEISKGELQGTKVILNSMNGSAGTEVYRTLQTAGVKVTALNLIVNGNFPHGTPNPISKGKMDEAIKIAGEQTGVIVIGLDGDGDRVVFGDKHGLFSAGISMVPILLRLKRIDQTTVGKAVCDPKVSPPSLDYWNKLGYKPILFRNGHSQIKDYMRSQHIAVAAEESGHYYHRMKKGKTTVYCENSLLTILLFLKAVQEVPALLSEMREIDGSVFTTGEINYQFQTDKERDKALTFAVKNLSKDKASISKSSPEGIDLQGIAFTKGIDTETKQIVKADWYSGFYRASTNEKSVARFYISSGKSEVLMGLHRKIKIICEKELNGTMVG